MIVLDVIEFNVAIIESHSSLCQSKISKSKDEIVNVFGKEKNCSMILFLKVGLKSRSKLINFCR